MSDLDRQIHYQPPQIDPQISRRALLIGGGLTAAALLLLKDCSGSEHHAAAVHASPTESPTPEVSGPSSLPETYSATIFPNTFTDVRAEAVARSMYVNPGTYFKFTPDTINRMNQTNHLETSKTLLPIFAPGVARYDGLFEASASENDVPINMLAILCTIESSGYAGAHSESDAWGLLQIVPDYHIDKFISRGYLPADATLEDYENAKAGKPSLHDFETYHTAFVEPENNIMVAGQILHDCIDQAKEENADTSLSRPILLARAAAVYNDGGEGATLDYDKLPVQTALYMDHFIRMALDVEVAGELERSGLKGEAILMAMQSTDINARAYAYDAVSDSRDSNLYSAYQTCNDDCALALPGVSPKTGKPLDELATRIETAYKAYAEGHPDLGGLTHYLTPAPPGLRIWLNSGGLGIFEEYTDTTGNMSWRI